MSDVAKRQARVIAAIPAAAAWIAAAVGAAVLAGWIFDVGALKTVLPGAIAMKANTAVAFILAGVALGLTRRGGGRWAAAAVLVIGAVTLSEYAFGWNLHVDELLFSDRDSAFRAPGRMAFTAAASFLVLGTALLWMSSRSARLRRSAEILGGIATVLALFEIEGFLLHTTGLPGYGRMAVPTAFVLPLLAIATIIAVPDGWLVARAQATGVGGMLTRRLLPVAIGMSMAIGKAAEVLGWHDPESVAVVVVLGMTVLSAASLWCIATIEDIERTREAAETGLRDAEDRFRWFFEGAPVGQIITAPDGKFLRVNRALCDLLGYSAAEAQSLSWPGITHPEDLSPSREAQRALLAGGADRRELEKRYRAKDGRWVWTHVSIGVHRGPDGKALYFLTHVQDITDRKRAGQELAASETYHRALTEQALDLTTLVDADGFVRYASPSYHGVLGYQPEQVIGQRVFDFVHPDDLAATLGIFADGSATPQATRAHEFRFRHHDGSWRVIAAVGRNLFDDPVIHAAIINGRDVTDQKVAAEHERTLLAELQRAVSEVRVLHGVLPICASCKRIHAEDGSWEAVESYVRERTNAEFTHGLCPDCAKATWGSQA